MTEYSLPWPGTTLGHAGPYSVGGATGIGWWDKAALTDRAGGRLTQTTLADIGVYYSVDDQLECTEAADTISIDVDTGAALVDGTVHYNDTDPVNVPIPAAAAGLGRIDLVVVRKNYSAITTYTPGGGAPTVPFRETHITVIRGNEAGSPAAPSVTQDTTRATYWDVPLCSVEVDDGGTLSSLTDLREYVDAETKILWVQSPVGRNVTDTSNITLDPTQYSSIVMGIELPDNKDAYAHGSFVVPQDFISGLTIEAVVYNPGATGNSYNGNTAVYSACNQDIDTHIATPGGLSAETATSGRRMCLASLSLASAVAGDMVNCIYQRDSRQAADTINASLWVLGFRVEYLGWK